MRIIKLLLLPTLVTLALGDGGAPEYTGDSVYQLTVENENQIQHLRSLEEKGFDFWTGIHFGKVDVRINAKDWAGVKQGLQDLDIKFTTSILDLDSLLEESRSWMSTGNPNRGRTGDFDFEEYHSTEEIQGYMQYLANNYDYVSIQSIGKSFQKRDMQVLKVCKGGCGNKPAIWIDGGIHAREWISPAAVTYWMKELVVENEKHPKLTEKLDWYILPVMNPDGYEYSREKGKIDGNNKTPKRYWRKTMSGWTSEIKAGECWGVDANRNWAFEWKGAKDVENKTCMDNYPGTVPFSEVETQHVAAFILKRKEQIKFFNTIHSYSQLVLLPWGYTEKKPENYNAMLDLAEKGAKKMQAVHGKKYAVLPIAELYPFTVVRGCSFDWALGVAGIPYSFGMELRPEDTEDNIGGHLLHPNQIIPTGQETWAFNMAIAEQIIAEFGEKTSDCCAKKTVGTDVYLFKEKSSETRNFNCVDPCVYTLEGTDESFCFAPLPPGSSGPEVECMLDEDDADAK